MVTRAKRRKRTASDRLAEELRARMVDALLDAARERRLIETCQLHEHQRLAHVATHHALELAERHLTITETRGPDAHRTA